MAAERSQLDRADSFEADEPAPASDAAGDNRRHRLSLRSKRVARSLALGFERCVRFALTRAIFGVLLCVSSFSSCASLLAACRRVARDVCGRASPHRSLIALFVIGACAGGLLVEDAERPCSHSRDVPLLAGVVGLKRSLFGESPEDELLQPRIVAMPEAADGEVGAQPKVKYTRPEFLRTELGVREKVLVSILASRESAARLALPLSRLMSSRAMQTLVFAKSMDYGSMPADLEAIKIDLSEQSTWEFPLRVMSHVQSSYAGKYDFYYFVPDTVYVRGQAFSDFISKVPITTDIYAGVPVGQHQFCDFDGGIVISKNVLDRITANLPNCTQLATASYTKTIGLCVARSVAMKCSSSAEMQSYATFVLQIPTSSLTLEALRDTGGINESLVIYPVVTPEAFYRLHEYYTVAEIESLKNEIKDAEVEAWRTKLLPLADPSADIIWPIGTHQQTRPEKRFDIKRWDYFDMTGIYYDNEFMNVRPLTGADKLDILEVVEKAGEVITKKYPDKYTYQRLANGYRKLDPNRGMMYIVDLEFRETLGYKRVLKRVELLRPVGTMEVIAMPPGVGSKTTMHLILPVQSDSSYEHWKTFLHKFKSEILVAKYDVELLVAFMYGEREHEMLAKKVDVYAPLKYELKAIKQGATIATVDVRTNSQLKLMEAVAKKLPPTSVAMIVSVEVDPSVELFDRVKLHSVKAKQVYSPIGFWQYMPELVYNITRTIPELEINRDFGRFETNSYEHISFHMSDYADSLSAANGSPVNDVYEVFLAARQLHIMRAVEPALKLRHREVNCAPDEDRSSSCSRIRQSNLASKARMALIYFKDKGLV